MKTINEAASCLQTFLKLGLLVAGMIVIFNAGWDRILEDPTYALVVIIFYYLVFSERISTDDEESKHGK